MEFLQNVWKRSGKMPAPLAERPVVDEEGSDLLHVFRELSQARGYSEAGAQPIPYVEIASWCALMGVNEPDARRRLTRIVRALDGIWLDNAHKRMQREMELAKRRTASPSVH